jgi:phosphoribosyl 1,2-cyclic phosphodiesterase
MSLYITSLNSGSNGNCYYIGNDHEAILVDAGISCREIEKRMLRLGLHIEKLKAVFISHEHTDHIRGVEVLARRHKLPVYITPQTIVSGRLKIEKNLTLSFRHHQAISIGKLLITAFPKQHDAADPCSFIVSCEEVHVGVFTDIGLACEQVIQYFRKCHAAFLESNYDHDMLENGGYPYHLKLRIRSGQGHLSNAQAVELFKLHRPAHMTHLVLSHLSKNNNTPELARAAFSQHTTGITLVVASRYEETAVYHVTASIPVIASRPILSRPRPVQLQMFT